MKYFVIADLQCVNLFKAIGVDGCPISLPCDAKNAVEQVLMRRDIGTLLISRTVSAYASEELEAHRRTGLFPSIIILDRE